MKTRFYITSILFGILILLALVPVFAQGDPDPQPVSTVEAAPFEIVPAPTASTDPMIQLSIWQIVAGFATAFSLGGLTIGTGIGLLASRLRHNPATMAAIEGLAASTPDTTVQQFTGLIDKFQYSLTEAFALVREALDKKPAAEKTPEEREAVRYPGPLEGGAPGDAAAFRGPSNGNP